MEINLNYKLAISNSDAKEIGKDLIAAATNERKKRFGKMIMEQIQELLSQRAQTENYIEKAKQEIAEYTRKLEAIESGNFTVGFDGIISYGEPTKETVANEPEKEPPSNP